MALINVIKVEHVPENCQTCFYGPNALDYNGKPIVRLGCAHADRQKDSILYLIGLKSGFPSYWLDHTRYERI